MKQADVVVGSEYYTKISGASARVKVLGRAVDYQGKPMFIVARYSAPDRQLRRRASALHAAPERAATPAPAPTSGYVPCACRDCMETAITSGGPALCSACQDGGCDAAGAGECAANIDYAAATLETLDLLERHGKAPVVRERAGAEFARRTNANANDAELLAIARKHCASEIETLEARNSDRLDFYDIAIWGLRDGLRAAYAAGEAARVGQAEDARDAAHEAQRAYHELVDAVRKAIADGSLDGLDRLVRERD